MTSKLKKDIRADPHLVSRFLADTLDLLVYLREHDLITAEQFNHLDAKWSMLSKHYLEFLETLSPIIGEAAHEAEARTTKES